MVYFSGSIISLTPILNGWLPEGGTCLLRAEPNCVDRVENVYLPQESCPVLS